MKKLIFILLSLTIIINRVSADDYDAFNHPFVQIITTKLKQIFETTYRKKNRQGHLTTKNTKSYINQVLNEIAHNRYDSYDHLMDDEEKPTLRETIDFIKCHQGKITERIASNCLDNSVKLSATNYKQVLFMHIEPHIQQFFEAFYRDNNPEKLTLRSIENIVTFNDNDT